MCCQPAFPQPGLHVTGITPDHPRTGLILHGIIRANMAAEWICLLQFMLHQIQDGITKSDALHSSMSKAVANLLWGTVCCQHTSRMLQSPVCVGLLRKLNSYLCHPFCEHLPSPFSTRASCKSQLANQQEEQHNSEKFSSQPTNDSNGLKNMWYQWRTGETKGMGLTVPCKYQLISWCFIGTMY